MLKSLQLRFEVFGLMTSLLAKPIDSQRVESFIQRLSVRFKLDLLDLVHQRRGIALPIDFYSTGELFLIQETLKTLIENTNPTLFDVGANTGGYSVELRGAFPNADIFSFEPNFAAFQFLVESLSPLGCHCYNVGFGATSEIAKLYTYADDRVSQHASLYREVFLELHRSDQLSESEFQLTTIDQFCEQHEVESIEFLKIDTEGHELEVLRGAERMLTENRIGIIQFEFNTLHVISRVFLKDFYDCLKGYRIYRLNQSELIPLFEYNTINEIFRFQNLIAVRKDLDAKLGH